jgi:hypothetical protein
MVDAINTISNNAKLTIYPEGGHGIWDRVFAEPDLLKWGLIDKIQATIDISTYKDIALVNLKAMNKKVLLLWLSKN